MNGVNGTGSHLNKITDDTESIKNHMMVFQINLQMKNIISQN